MTNFHKQVLLAFVLIIIEAQGLITKIYDDPRRKQQGVGRTGREDGDPIISSSYVDSSKIGNPDKTKDQLETSSPLETGEAEKGKIDLQEFAKKTTEQIEKIISNHHMEGESAVAGKVIELVCSAYN